MNQTRNRSLVGHDDGDVFRRRLTLIAGLGLAARLCVVVWADRVPERFDFPDTHRYIRVARHIAAGEGPMDAPRIRAGTDPIYPALLSLGVLGGLDEDAQLFRLGRLVNTAFGVCSIVLIAVLGRRLIGPAVGLIAAGICAMDPIGVFFNSLVLTETCYTTLLLGALLALTRLDSPRWVAAALAGGVCLGLGALTRSSSLLLIVALLPFAWHFGRRGGRGRGAVALVVLAAVVTMLPTMARNARLLGAIVPVRSGLGESLLEALGPWADGGPGMERIEYPKAATAANEVERDRLCRDAAVDWALAHPAESARLALVKLARTWSITPHAAGYADRGHRILCWLSVGPEFALAIAGAWMLRRRPVVLFLLLAPAVYVSVVHMVFVGSVRYRVPIMPLLFILSAVAVQQLAAGRRRGPAGEPPA